MLLYPHTIWPDSFSSIISAFAIARSTLIITISQSPYQPVYNRYHKHVSIGEATGDLGLMFKNGGTYEN
jgi:hypothetical protein